MGVETTGSRAIAKSRNRHCRRVESLPSMASKMAAFPSKAGKEMKSWFAREFKLRRQRRLRPISWQEKSVSKTRGLTFTTKALKTAKDINGIVGSRNSFR